MRFLLTALALVLLTNSASAGFIDGNVLSQYIPDYYKAENGDRSTNYQSAASIKWYVLGVADVMLNKTDGVVCYPSNVNSHQVVAIAVKYLKEHPERWADPADNIIWDSLKDTFPCANK